MASPLPRNAETDPLPFQEPANDDAFSMSEEAHRAAVHEELRALDSALLLRVARGTLSADVWVPCAGETVERQHLFELLAERRRILLVGARASGKSALVSLLTAHVASREAARGGRVPILVSGGQLERVRLDEAELGRLNPLLGARGVREAMAAGRSLLILDGLDEAASPGALKASIVALAAAYPSAHFLITTRPLPARIAGKSETALDGFLTVQMAAPKTATVASIEGLDEHRLPARWAEHVADETRTLLDAWAPDRIPPGSMLAHCTSRGRLMIVASLAMTFQETRSLECSEPELVRRLEGAFYGARWFADTEQLLHEREPSRGGEPLNDPDAVARDLIGTIRQVPGVVAEKRQGVFGFASLAVQQYLTAVFYAERGGLQHLVELRDDRWWHGVLVLTASLDAPWSSTLPAGKLLGALLTASALSDSPTTFLAARCADVARHVPPLLRAQIDQRVRAALPPRSSLQVAHLVDDIGDIAAPALLDALRTADPDERACIVTALGRLYHPPARRVVAQLVSDEEPTTEPMLISVWKVDAAVEGYSVGFFAFAAFFNLALASPVAHRMFDEVLRRASSRTLAHFIGLVGERLLHDLRWGVPEERVRDPDRVTVLLDKLMTAAEQKKR